MDNVEHELSHGGLDKTEVLQIFQTTSHSTFANSLCDWRKEQDATPLLALDSNLPQAAEARIKP